MHSFRFALLAGALAAAFPLSAHADVTLPTGETLDKVDFERHIMGLLGRMGCNGGSCHGSFQGKGGFTLSLFGYEPEKDFWRVSRDGQGRRINLTDPDNSLLLLKATGQVEHGGSIRFGVDSWQYKVFQEWIKAGARWEAGSGKVESVRVEPPEIAFKKADEEKQVVVKARFADGSENDITAFCDFRTNDDAVAEVSNLGMIKSLRAGSTAIIVSYRGNVLPVNVLVPMDSPVGFVYPKVPEHNFIDGIILSRLKQLNMVPSDVAGDEEFLRRVTIDAIGQLPTPEEIRAFTADRSSDKRAKKIDELLSHPLHAAMWATKFSDITGNDTTALENPVGLKAKRSQLWHDWFRKRVADNMPYDEIVRGVLTATSRDGMTPTDWLDLTKKIDGAISKGLDTDGDYASRKSLDLYWRRQQAQTIEQWGERTAAAFMGIRLECAQCHKHPFDRWSQADYRAHANIFGAVTFGTSPETKKLIDAENAARKMAEKKAQLQILLREVFVGDTARSLAHPDTGLRLGARALGGPEITFAKGQDMREALFNWLVQPDNPFFAKSFVNRIWGHYLGVGIVNPLDDFSLANPPSNEKLLDALAQEFIKSKFDIRHMERLIMNSRAYQLSSKTNDTNKLDKNNYARAYVRPMMAEAVVDVLNCALGTEERFGPDVKASSRAVEVGATLIGNNPSLTYAFRIFGRPPRSLACDCERAMEPALPQKLYLMTDPVLLAKFNDPSGRLQKMLASKKTDGEILEELFLSTLSRLPTEQDRKLFEEYRTVVRDRRAALTDTLWALINTREFILNH